MKNNTMPCDTPNGECINSSICNLEDKCIRPKRKILANHYSVETSYLVDDYPYGGLRCKIRFWLDVNKKGTRFISQTTNPKKPGEVWNNPKASTYSLAGAMYLDEKGHCHWTVVSVYDISKFREFVNTYRDGLLPDQIALLEKFATSHEKREAAKTSID